MLWFSKVWNFSKKNGSECEKNHIFIKKAVKNCVDEKKILHLCCELPEMRFFVNQNNPKLNKKH